MQAGQWIDIREQLPEFIGTDHNSRHSAYVLGLRRDDPSEPRSHEERCVVCRLYSEELPSLQQLGQLSWMDVSGEVSADITHWKPLPGPPGE